MHSTIRASAGALAVSMALISAMQAGQGGGGAAPRYQVLAPITQGNLTVFPVAANSTHDTSGFSTLDEGLRSGEVVVTEAGQRGGLVRRRGIPIPPPGGGAEVNHLFIVNNSKRPLVLLAGEIVTGGKQDRVVGKDRIIPSGSDADLDVFCVEPGRWTELRSSSGLTQEGFFFMGLAQPSVRGEVMAKKDQQKVWDRVNQANAEAAVITGARTQGGPSSSPSSSSYARNMNSTQMQREVYQVGARSTFLSIGHSSIAGTKSRRCCGCGERRHYLGRYFRFPGLARKVLAEAGALLCG